MTCKEFLRLNATDAAFKAMTRAERSASGKHYNKCRKCRRFIAKSPPDKPFKNLGEVVDCIAESIGLIIAERDDPETRP